MYNDLFENDKKNMLFQSYVQTLFSVDELIALLEESKARSPELDYDRFELAVMVRRNAKQTSVAQKHRDPATVHLSFLPSQEDHSCQAKYTSSILHNVTSME